jgi:hypothetical protein
VPSLSSYLLYFVGTYRKIILVEDTTLEWELSVIIREDENEVSRWNV